MLKIILRYVKPPAKLLEAGAAPFLLSAMFSLAGYEVVALDVEPEEYIDVAEMFGVKVFKCDLERDNIPLPDESFDIAILSEVMEHLNPYYISHTFSEINRVLKYNGYLVVTTPNIASLFRRLKLLMGKNPIYKLHVREYTLSEVIELVRLHGFSIVESGYLDAYDKSLLDAKSDKYLRKLPYIETYIDMLKFVLHNLSVNNILRVLAYPLIKIKKSLRTTCYILAKKSNKVEPSKPKRW